MCRQTSRSIPVATAMRLFFCDACGQHPPLSTIVPAWSATDGSATFPHDRSQVLGRWMGVFGRRCALRLPRNAGTANREWLPSQKEGQPSPTDAHRSNQRNQTVTGQRDFYPFVSSRSRDRGFERQALVRKKARLQGNRAVDETWEARRSSSDFPIARPTPNDLGSRKTTSAGGKGGHQQDHGGDQRSQRQKLSGQGRHFRTRHRGKMEKGGLVSEGKGGHGLVLFLQQPPDLGPDGDDVCGRGLASFRQGYFPSTDTPFSPIEISTPSGCFFSS